MKHREAIQALKSALAGHYGRTLDQFLVYGSVARNTSRDSSDIDVMVILDATSHEIGWQEEAEAQDIALDIELEYDVVFDIKVIARSVLRGLYGHSPFVENALREGMTV